MCLTCRRCHCKRVPSLEMPLKNQNHENVILKGGNNISYISKTIVNC